MRTRCVVCVNPCLRLFHCGPSCTFGTLVHLHPRPPPRDPSHLPAAIPRLRSLKHMYGKHPVLLCRASALGITSLPPQLPTLVLICPVARVKLCSNRFLPFRHASVHTRLRALVEVRGHAWCGLRV
jgi:hypothetical protein